MFLCSHQVIDRAEMFYHYLWWRDNQAAMNSRRPYSVGRQVRNINGYLDILNNCDVVDLYRLDKHGINYFAERICDHPAISRNTSAHYSPEILCYWKLYYEPEKHCWTKIISWHSVKFNQERL